MLKFIQVILCDNDFADVLEEATRRVYSSLGTKSSEEDFKNCVVSLASSLHEIQLIGRGFSYRGYAAHKYLDSSVKVIFSDNKPDVDHDGGSIAIDCSTNYIWRF